MLAVVEESDVAGVVATTVAPLGLLLERVALEPVARWRVDVRDGGTSGSLRVRDKALDEADACGEAADEAGVAAGPFAAFCFLFLFLSRRDDSPFARTMVARRWSACGTHNSRRR